MLHRRRRAERLAIGWSALLPSRTLCAWVLLGGLVLLPAFSPPQAQRRPAQALQQATRAFIEGRYDEAERLANALDGSDPNVVALKARVAIERGRYAEAEASLGPVAVRAPGSEAALEFGLLEQMLGRPGAQATLDKVVIANGQSAAAPDLARAARALRALGSFQDANATYRAAAAAAPKDAAINTAWGELFLEKHSRAEAVKSFEAALQADPMWTPAILGLAEALEEDNPPQATATVQRALAINPSSVRAHVLLASQVIDEGNREEARSELQKALAVNPSSLVAHAWLAAIAYVEDRQADFDAEVAKTLAIAPTYAEVYRVAAALAARNYRFDEAVVLTRRALALEPKNPRALADLGVHLLRTGDEPGARTALEASFAIDPYNVVTYNLLGLMDVLDKFTTVRDGDLVVRMQADEAPVLGEYAVPLAHQALSTMAARYEFTPRGPVLIEIFPSHDDFAVRNVGLPGMIGALGACFGRVVTMDSPKARPPGDFQWEATLWHELAHVITLQMSNQRVPRWLTEGISVYEQKRARPDWARQMDIEFAMLLSRGETLKLRDLNAAFTDPRRISIAYYEASLLVEHLVKMYGDAGLRKLLRAYGLGLEAEVAMKSALGTDLDDLQDGFDATLGDTFGRLRRALAGPPEAVLGPMPVDSLQSLAAERGDSYPVQMALGGAMRLQGDADGAMEAFERAAKLVPIARGRDSPHAQMAEIALERKDRSRAMAELQALVDVDFGNLDAARQLRSLMKEAGVDDPSRLGPVERRIAGIDPFDAEAHAALGRFAMQRNEPEVAAREFRVVLALGPLDQAAAHTDLAESYFESGKAVEAKKQTIAALEIAPTYPRAQELLLKLVGEGRR